MTIGVSPPASSDVTARSRPWSEAPPATIPGNDRRTMSRQFPPEQATSEREFCLKHKRPLEYRP